MRLFRQTLLTVSVMCPILVAGCSSATEPRVPAVLTALPRALTPGEQQVRGAGNDFSLALFRRLATAQPGENVFVSPLSASMSLGMALNGAGGSTFGAMRATLGLGSGDLAEIDAGYKGLIALLRGLDPSTTFQIANSVWYRSGFPFNQSFLDVTKSAFDAQVQGLNFSDAPGSLSAINSWVNASTAGKIPSILDQIDPLEVMFLINAIYFKGSWRARFDPAQTRQASFYAPGGTIQVPMMNRAQSGTTLRVGGQPHLQVAELPYGNGAFAMTILLPELGADIDSLAESLTPARWALLLSGLNEMQMAVSLPKFKLTYERLLKDDLTALGMGIAFSESADFSGMSSQQLLISRVKQKTFVDVNEDGTEAGAATVTGIQVTALGPSLIVNHPFVFALRERLSGTILFIGKIVRPPGA